MNAYVRKPKSAQTIRKYVDRLLSESSIRNPPVPVDRVAERLGAAIKLAPFDGELAGVLMRRGSEVIIGVNSRHHSNRQRFTIAHEIGHLVLHKPDFHLDKKLEIQRRDSVSSLAVDPDEIEANRFAAELLMPHSMILNDLRRAIVDVEEDQEEIRSLAERYSVSLQAMTLRIVNV